MAVALDAIEGAALVFGAKVSSKALGTNVLAVVFGRKVQSLVPFESGETVFRDLSESLNSFDASLRLNRGASELLVNEFSEVILKFPWIRSHLILPVVNGTIQLGIISTNKRTKSLSRLFPRYDRLNRWVNLQHLGNPVFTLLIELEVVGVQDRCHHGACLVGARGHAGQFICWIQHD